MTRALPLFVLVGLACGGDATAPECNRPVDVNVSTSAPPLITWRPNCAVARLSATASVSTGFSGLYWAISAGDRLIESGVRFGEAPPGTVEHSGTRYLFSGDRVVIQLESPLGTTIGSTLWVVP